MPKPSKIFSGYRALGFVSNHIPLSLRYILRRNENLAVTVVGKCFHTYGCDKLTLLTVSGSHPDEINSLASDSFLVFTSCKNIIYSWHRGTELKCEYKGHESTVHLLLPFGPHLISVDEKSTLMVFHIETKELILELTFSNETFKITCMIHPSTYLNKILLGSAQGKMHLWNLKTTKLVHQFQGWGHPITVLEQAPAIDVVAVGLSNGDIMIHNLKFDETLMKFSQDWGCVTSLSFRTDGKPIMTSGSPLGHIAVWDLEKKCLHSTIREAHSQSVAGMKFFPNEPLLITSSPDNTLKVWIFDLPDDGGRLLRHREGHGAPPIKIRFHGSNGNNILSSGADSTLRSFSTRADNFNKNLGQASYNRKAAKKKGIRHDTGKLPPITDFCSEITREKEWDNIIACHRNLNIATTWSYNNCRMGSHKLLHKRFIGKKDIVALCVYLSSCGNFVLIGYNQGYIDKFNVQSGIFRGTFGDEKAHIGSIRGVVSDALNQIVVSGGSDKLLKFWKFKEMTLVSSLPLQSMVSKIIIHKESSLIAVALDDFSVVVVDQDTRRIVRTFDEHYGSVSDMTFSCDSRWLIVALMDSTIKTWDLPSGRMLDNFIVSPVCIGLSMSPSSEFLATIHADDLGIYLWSNMTLYSHVPLQPLPADYEPRALDLPLISLENTNVTEEEGTEGEKMEIGDNEDIPEFESPAQIAEQLITLSLLPNSRWQNLLYLDVIKRRNKPKEPVFVPKNAPFFLPVISGLKPQFAIEEEKSSGNKIDDKLMLQILQRSSSFSDFLLKCREKENYDYIIEKLKSMSPSMLDVEIRCLAPENGGSVEAMVTFMECLEFGLKRRQNFEAIQAYLGLFLQIHWELISSEKDLRESLNSLKCSQSESWLQLQSKFNQCICLVNYLRSAVI